MGKHGGKKKKNSSGEKSDEKIWKTKLSESSQRGYDEDTAIFILMAQELKNEGNSFFQKRDYEGAILSYEKAIKLLPTNHIDVACVRSNMAACYMQVGISEYPRAIHECNLALEVSPRYSKALLKRARCYEALNKLDLARRDVGTVLKMEPNNLMAIEVSERVERAIEREGSSRNGILPEYLELPPLTKTKEKAGKKKSGDVKEKEVDGDVEGKTEEKRVEGDVEKIVEEKNVNGDVDRKTEEKKVDGNVEKKVKVKEKEVDGDIEGKTKEKRVEGDIEKNVKEKNVNGDVDRKMGDKKVEANIAKKVKEKEVDGDIEGKTKEKRVEGDIERNAKEKNVNGDTDRKTKEKKVEPNIEKKEKEVNGDTDGKTKERKVDGDVEENVKEKKVDGKTEEFEKDEKVNGSIEESKHGKTVDEIEMQRDIAERKVFVDVVSRKADDLTEEKITEDKLVVEEEKSTEKEPRRTVKLVFRDDIRWAQIPLNCDVLKLREVILDRFPGSKTILVKYRDQEGDLVTITSTEELRLAENSTENGSLKLYIVEANPDQDPLFKKTVNNESVHSFGTNAVTENGKVARTESACISDWIIQFAQLFKNHVGFDVEAYLDLHEVGMKLYSDAMEETVTSEEAQDIFGGAAEKFQEMAALALFNWGNVHMSRARKRVYSTEDSSKEPVLTKIKSAYDWAQTEYTNAGKRYEEALKIKPNFYEAVLALGQQQFEQAKISWYFAVGTDLDLESWPSTEALQLYNKAEENMEKGMQMWEEEKQVDDQIENVRAQILVLWGTMLYERSVMEFKLGLPVWHECLEVAVEKFELAGVSSTDIAVMIKNHCSNNTASEGLGFNIDEIVQAWNEMYEAKKWRSSVPSFRLEPLLRRRVSKIYYALENA